MATVEEQIETERAKNYGPPERNLAAIAMAWQAYLVQVFTSGRQLERRDVANMMTILKLVRAGANLDHVDNYDDSSVYTGFSKRWSVKKEVDGGKAAVAVDGD